MKYFWHFFYSLGAVFSMYMRGWNTMEAVVSFFVWTTVCVVMALYDVRNSLQEIEGKAESKLRTALRETTDLLDARNKMQAQQIEKNKELLK